MPIKKTRYQSVLNGKDWFWEHRATIGAICVSVLTLFFGYQGWLISSRLSLLEQEKVKRDEESRRPCVMFENSEYYFSKNASNQLVPFGSNATNPIVVNTCEQALSNLRVSWEPVAFERIWPDGKLGDFVRSTESPIRNNMLHSKGEKGQVLQLPEWIGRTETNPMGWNISPSLKGVIFGSLHVEGEAKDGQQLRQFFNFEVSAFAENDETHFRLRLTKPFKNSFPADKQMAILVRLGDSINKAMQSDPGDKFDLDSIPYSPDLFKDEK